MHSSTLAIINNRKATSHRTIKDLVAKDRCSGVLLNLLVLTETPVGHLDIELIRVAIDMLHMLIWLLV